jgi:hypothetical protein
MLIIMYNIIEKHFSVSIAPVQSRGGSLVNDENKIERYINVYKLPQEV